MMKLAWRRAAIVLAGGGALTLAAGLLPAQAATTGWRTDATFAVRGELSIFTGVGASSPSDAWATGFAEKTTGTTPLQIIIRHWNGKAWRLVTLPAKIGREWARQGPAVSTVGVSSARSVWDFGGFLGGYLRLDGSRWSLGHLPGASQKSGTLLDIDAAKVFSGTDVWAFGVRVSASGVAKPYAAHYNGRKWSTTAVPGGGVITAVAALSSGDMWAVENAAPSSMGLATSAVARSAVAASPAARLASARLRAAASAAAAAPVVLKFTDSTGWKEAAKQPGLAATDQLFSAVAEPGGHVWFGGSASNSAKGKSPLAAEWNGRSWSVSDLPGKASSADWQLAAMAPDGTRGIWALAVDGSSGTERIWHLHGTAWSQVKPAFGKRPWLLAAVALVPRTHSAWAVGAVEAGKSSVNGLIAVNGQLPR
jgi:hypothetical protein